MQPLHKVLLIVGITIVVIAIVWPLKAHFMNKKAKEKKDESEDNESDK